MQGSTHYRGMPDRLQHDTSCVHHRGGLLAHKCTCGEYVRDPDLWRTVRPQGFTAFLECVRERRDVTPYVAQLPGRH